MCIRDSSKVDSINEADFILTTGLYDDSFETPKDYNDLFNDFMEKEKPIVCVNPDEIVYRGVNSIFCAGALGKYYEKLGGKVVYYGKPYVEIYDQAFQDLKKMNNIENKLNSGDIVLLDGGMGAELENLGASMDKDLWSGRCSIDEPDIVYKAHQNFINSGADIITTNTCLLYTSPSPRDQRGSRMAWSG